MKFLALFAVVATASAPGAHRPVQPLRYLSVHRDDVLGTSADLTFVTPSIADASRAERVALSEIERLRRILSVWDSTSQISQLFRHGKLDHPSAELTAVLEQYSAWQRRSGNAYSPRVSELTRLWQAAAARGTTPDSATLATAVARTAGPAWRIDPVSGQITALTTAPVDLNSLGKGFIIDHALAAVRDSVASLAGAMIDIGGDVHVWGAAPTGKAWRVAVANPRDHADNGVPLTRLTLRDRAVSSSGDYERGFNIAGKHYSHIVDPRTGYPADNVIGATVVAADNATANALATTLSVLTPADGFRLIAQVPGAEALLVTAKGEVMRTPGFSALETPVVPSQPLRAAPFTAALAIDVTPAQRMRHAPYVAVWITDTAGHEIRTLAFWGPKPKYQRELSRWWNLNGADYALVDAVTRATRPAGHYTLEWDGLDEHGAPVAAGPYMFWLEVAFEDGPHSSRSVTLACGATHAAGTIASADAFGGAEISCDPAK